MRHLLRTTRAARRATSRVATTVSLALASLALAACGGDGGGPDGGGPSRIELVGVAPTGTVNAAVTPAPSVKVTDAQGRAVANASVTFTAGGGGTATEATQRTNAEGVATVGSWTLGTVAGTSNTLQVKSGSASTTITATALAAAAAIHEAAPGQSTSQLAQPSTAVAQRPAVRVTDSFGNPKPGMAVVFTVDGNSGTVTEGVQTTNSEGIATVGNWTVGSTLGAQTMVASVTGASLPPVTFVANVIPCAPAPYTLGTTVTGTLSATDCLFEDGSFFDLYRVTSTSAINHDFRLASSAFDSYLLVASGDFGKLLAEADDESATTLNARVHFIAPPGSYLFLANAYPDETGPYTFSSTGGARAPGCDLDAWVVPGVSWPESIASTDCSGLNGAGTYGDGYLMVMDAGRSTTVTMRSTAVNSYLVILRAGSTDWELEGQNDNGAGGNDARVTFTAPTGAARSLYLILASTAAANATGGAYTLDVSAPAGLVAGAPLRAPAGSPMIVGPGLLKGAMSPWRSAPWGASLRRGAKAAR